MNEATSNYRTSVLISSCRRVRKSKAENPEVELSLKVELRKKKENERNESVRRARATFGQAINKYLMTLSNKPNTRFDAA